MLCPAEGDLCLQQSCLVFVVVDPEQDKNYAEVTFQLLEYCISTDKHHIQST